MKRILIALAVIAITPIVAAVGIMYAFKEWTKDEIRQRKDRYVG